MKRAKDGWSVPVYAIGILAALTFRLLDHKTTDWFFGTCCFGVYTSLEMSILMMWLASVRRRFLPSTARACTVATGILFLFYVAVIAVNYRIADQNDLALKRFCWYLYYLPLIGVPALFLITCISIVRGKRRALRWGAVCLSVSAVLFSFVITNDLHYLVFVPEDPAVFNSFGGYGYGPVFAFEMSFGVLRLAVLFRKRLQLLIVLLPLALLPFYIPITKLCLWLIGDMFLPIPMFSVFCIVLFFELCIRFRMIPYNENYSAFFGNMQFPAVITDDALTGVFHSALPVEADRDRLREALSGPLYISEGIRLFGKRLKAGSVFYTEDERELVRMNERLQDANEMLLSEQTLIKAENELREQSARLESRSRIYARIYENTYTRQLEIDRLLQSTSPGAPDFDRVIARVSVLNAYIKRSANLLLVSEGETEISGRELTLALEESARVLRYMGVNTEVSGSPDASLPRSLAFDLYGSFEAVLESSLTDATRFLVAVSGRTLRVVTDGAVPASPPQTPLGLTVRQSDGSVYYTVNGEGGRAG